MKIDVLALKFSGFLINGKEIHRSVGVSLVEGAGVGRRARAILWVLGKLDASESHDILRV